MDSMQGRWLVRLLLAVILFLGSEILLWSNPLGRSFLEWMLAISGYLLLAVLLLDLMVRCNIRDLFGLISLAGIYGLFNGLLINPYIVFAVVPDTLVTQAMGAHSLLGLEMLVVFLALTGGYQKTLRWLLIGGATVVGLAWGTWARWSSLLPEMVIPVVPQETLLMMAAGVIVLIFVLLRLAYRYAADLTPPGVLMSKREWMVFTPLFCLLIFIRQDFVTTPVLVIIALILGINGAILWFRLDTKLPILLVHHLPIQPLPPVWLLLTTMVLFSTGLFSYNLPLINPEGIHQLTFVILGFNLYGFAWLPFISMVLGVRAYSRQVQARPL
jgi:hypothetical protein